MRKLLLALFLLLSSDNLLAQNQDNHFQSSTKQTLNVVKNEVGTVEFLAEDHEPVSTSPDTEKVIPDSWIVAFKPDSVAQFMQKEASIVATTSQAISPSKSNAPNLKQRLNTYEASLLKQQDDFFTEAQSKGLVQFSGRHFTQSINAMVVYTSENDLATIQSFNGVKSITPNRIYSPLLTRSTRAIKADQVWQQKDKSNNDITGLGVKIAILDTGIDYTHESFGGCFGDGCKVAGGYDFVNDDNDPIEDEDFYQFLGHGTHVAGIAAANGQIRGVAYNADLYAYKVCGVENCPTELILAGLEMAANPDGDPLTDDGADVINLSLGSRFGSPDDPIPTLINQLAEQGIVVVVAAGNDGGFANIGDIASARDAITVAASNQDYSGIAEFSSAGPVRSADYIKPDISAPGDVIESSCVNEFSVNSTCFFSGTSMASPHIAGVVALLLQESPSLTPEQVKSRLVTTSERFDGIDSASQGAGFVNAFAALNAKTLITPAIGSLGNVDASIGVWRRSVELEITNTGNENKAFSLEFEQSQNDGINYNIIGSKEFSLRRLEHRVVEVEVVVDTDEAKLKELNALTLSRLLYVRTGDEELQVPVVFSKMAILSMDNTDFYSNNFHIFNKRFGFFYVNDETQPDYYLPMGDYHAWSIDNFHDKTKITVMEDINLSHDSGFTFVESGQSNVVQFTNLRGIDGDVVPPGDYQEFYLLDITHEEAKYSTTIRESSFNLREKPLYVSNLSNDFTLRLAGALNPDREDSESLVRFYTFSRKIEGINQDLNIELLHNDMNLLSFKMHPSEDEHTAEFNLLHRAKPEHYPASSFDASGFFMTARDSEQQAIIFDQPYNVELYGNVRDDKNNYDLGILNLTFYKEDRTYDGLDSARFDNIQFDQSGGITRWRASSFVNNAVDDVLFSHKISSNLNIIDTGLTPIHYLVYNNVEDRYEVSNGFENILSFSDLSVGDRLRASDNNYDLYCNGSLFGSGMANGFGGGSRYFFGGCETMEMRGRGPNFIADAEYQSTYTITLHENTALDIVKAPAPLHIYPTHDNTIVTNPDEEGTRINAVFLEEPVLENVTIEFKMNGGWQNLNVVKDEFTEHRDIYSALLPMPDKAGVAHIRVKGADALDNRSEVLVAGALVIGKDQSTVFTDDFDHDGIPDYKDMDDDNDGIDDLEDVLVLDALHDDDSEVLDTDNDGIGNNEDTDDDNDGVEDSEDDLPFDASETVDTDGDGIGNNKDKDDDGDGVLDFRDCASLDRDISRICVALDFDGDGQADVAVRRPSTFFQYVKNSSDAQIQRHVFGKRQQDIPVTGDFDGDGLTDIAVRRPSNQTWYIRNSSGSNIGSEKGDGIQRRKFGLQAGDIPVPADYDGDGITDIAVRRPSNGFWYIKRSSDNEIERHRFFTDANDIPVTGDFDGDGIDDVAYANISAGKWFIRHSNDASLHQVEFELSAGDIPVTGEFDGDGKTDIAVRRPSEKAWYILNSDSNERTVIKFGKQEEDIPILADYDGDGITDISVRRPSEFMQFILRSSDGEIERVRFGLRATDIPLAAPVGIKMDMLN